MDRLSNIEAFVCVAESGSFAAAAKRLHLANSVVSKRVKDLEDDLKVRLFHRTTRKVSLTDAGYRYFEEARRLLAELAEVEAQLRAQNEKPVGTLKVSAPVSFSTQYLGPAVAGYLDTYPDVELRVTLHDRLVDLASEDFDLALAIGTLDSPTLVTRKLAESRRVVVASPEYYRLHGKPQKPQDLLHHNCMSYSNLNDGKAWPFIVGGRRHLQPVRGRFVANNGLLLLQGALSGCGIALLPTFIAGPHILAGRLKIALEGYEDEALVIQAAWTYQRHMSARMRTFIDYLAEYFSGNAPA
jgi:DNA-binding transcriptional LysR family regulator